jgi:hypothetical protein
VTLLQTDPPVWRRLRILDCTLEALHRILHRAMGWAGEHRYAFFVGDQCYVDAALASPTTGARPVDSISLSQVPRFGHSCIYYEYDLGDTWRHEVVIETSLGVEDSLVYPACLDGRRACPPEDCGGIWAYRTLVDQATAPSGDESSAVGPWQADFNPDAFDPAEVNRALRNL